MTGFVVQGHMWSLDFLTCNKQIDKRIRVGYGMPPPPPPPPKENVLILNNINKHYYNIKSKDCVMILPHPLISSYFNL